MASYLSVSQLGNRTEKGEAFRLIDKDQEWLACQPVARKVEEQSGGGVRALDNAPRVRLDVAIPQGINGTPRIRGSPKVLLETGR